MDVCAHFNHAFLLLVRPQADGFGVLPHLKDLALSQDPVVPLCEHGIYD